MFGLSGNTHEVKDISLKTERWERSHQLLNINLLSTYCILGTVLNVVDPMMNRQKFLTHRSRKQTVSM